jgi:hypothetical protein
MLTRVQFEAQNARVTQSLKNDGAGSSLFALYLAMQVTDPTLHDACELNVAEEQGAYTGIESPNALFSFSARPNLYSSDADYDAQKNLYSAIPSTLNPSVYIQFLNAMRPQPLHFSAHATQIPEDVINNLPLSSQHQYKVAQSDVFNPSADTLHKNTHHENFGVTEQTNEQSFADIDDELPKNAGLDAFLQSIEQAREFAF